MNVVNITDKWVKENGEWWYLLKGGGKTRGKVVPCSLKGCGNSRLAVACRATGGRKYCSRKCSGRSPEREAPKGFKHYNWSGGRVNKKGYILVHCPDHPHAVAGKYVLEHRLVMEKKLGRHLNPYERVHHRNGIRTDNRPENLALVTEQVHFGEVTCPHCQKSFAIT
jgi:hypothetical protein